MNKKIVLIFSLLTNVVLIALFWNANKNFEVARTENQRLDQARLEDIKNLEMLFQDTISKEEIFSILKSKFKNDEWFDKLDEHGIGFKGLFLIFDEAQNLKQIQVNSMQGK